LNPVCIDPSLGGLEILEAGKYEGLFFKGVVWVSAGSNPRPNKSSKIAIGAQYKENPRIAMQIVLTAQNVA
jgi:hypothetical protein